MTPLGRRPYLSITPRILGGSLHTIKKNAESLVGASKETGLEANGDRTTYVVMDRDQSARRSHGV